MADKADQGVKQDELLPQKKAEQRPPLLVAGQLIAAHSGKRYLVERLLGKGGFGEVYQVSVYKDPGKKFAMKVELNALNGKASSMLRLKVEIHVFEQIVQSQRVDRTHFVKMHDKGMTEQFKYYVMDVIWNSLKDMCQKTLNNAPLSGSTLVGIARQTIRCISAMHELGFLHRDIKWQNFAVGVPPMDYLIYIIDFGIARPYREKNGKVKVARASVRFLGTPRYASIRGLQGEEQGRRDDLESWLYMMLELYSPGNCPWICSYKFDEIIKLKSGLMQYSQQLFKDGKLKMPKTYCKIIDYISQMKYEEDPDYQWFDIALIAGARAENINPDAPFDWIGKYEEDKKREELKRKEEEARKIPDKVVRDEPSKFSETDRKESRKKDGKMEKKRESRKKKNKKKQPEGDDQTLISMEEMLEDLKKEKRRRLKKKSGERTEDEYWKTDEDNSQDDRSDEDDSDYRRRKKKKKSRKRRSRERTRDYSDRDDDDDEDYGSDGRDTYDKTPHRRRGQKKRSGGRKKASKLSRKKTYEDENIPRIPDPPNIPDEESKNVDKDAKKTPAKTPGKTPDKKTPEKEKAQDLKDKDKKDKDKKESGKKDEKPPVKIVPVEPAKKASEAAPKKEPADAKKN